MNTSCPKALAGEFLFDFMKYDTPESRARELSLATPNEKHIKHIFQHRNKNESIKKCFC